MGTFLPHAAGLEQLYQDGGRYRRLLAYRVRVQQVQVGSHFYYSSVLFPSIFRDRVMYADGL